tara:strand:- start:808 stop:1209 length:402 start_codon:yes stop_codon:yes gene_type:complete
MKPGRPGATGGLRHVALFVHNFEASEHFFVELMGMEVEWRPDPDNVYLTTGNDNLALHRVSESEVTGKLDHVGFFIQQIDKIDDWYAFLEAHGVVMLTEPRSHRDGARSFYCREPSDVKVQVIYHPPIASLEK